MATNAKETQSVVELVGLGDPNAKNTQDVLEVVGQRNPNARFTQVVLELVTPNSSNGGISVLDQTAPDDKGTCINARYVTYGFADQADRMQLQLGLARVLLAYLLLNIEGSGQFSITLLPETLGTSAAPNPYPATQPPFTLATPALDDVNVPLNVTANRAFIQIDSAGQSCSKWSLKRIDLGLAPDPRILITGR